MWVRESLVHGLVELNLNITDFQIEQMLKYIDLIVKWNKAYNLTAIKQKTDMISLHLLDSLTVLPYLEGEEIADIGTGAGLPGIPLAICLPKLNFTLIDSNAKKTRFVQQAVLELKLSNVTVAHSRVEDYQPKVLFNTVLTRAFAELSDIMEMTQHLLTANGKFIAMKAKCSDQELAKVMLNKQVIPVKIPEIDAERNLICIQF